MEAESTLNWFIDKFFACKDSGMKSKHSFENIVELGYPSTLRQLYKQIALRKSTGRPLARVKPAGRKPKLNAAQMKEIHKHIVTQNDKLATINRLALCKHILVKHRVALCRETVGNYMKKMKLSKRKTSKVTGKSIMPFEEKVEVYWKWILRMKAKKKFFLSLDKIHSIDTTYTRDPQRIRDTIAPVGSPSQRDGGKRYKYSDAIITCISPDGLNHTPCVLHTYNPAMAPQATSNGKKAKAKRAHFVELLEEYDIPESRIVYSKSTKHFRGEDPDMLTNFLVRYDFPKDDLFLHDGGGAYKRKKVSIFDTLGYTNHEVYPAVVHQHLSPNDNNLHGVKSVWKMEHPNFSDDPEGSLRLMQLIDFDTIENGRHYFARNMLRVTKKRIPGVMAH